MNVNGKSDSAKVAVLVELLENPRTRRYNVAAQLSELPELYTEVPSASFRDEAYTKTGSVGTGIYESIRDTVPGVVRLLYGRYSVDVTINPVFDWGDVEAGVLAAISQAVVGELDVRYDDSEQLAASFRAGLIGSLIGSLGDVDVAEAEEEDNSGWPSC
jgi:hypothetical protein